MGVIGIMALPEILSRMATIKLCWSLYNRFGFSKLVGISIFILLKQDNLCRQGHDWFCKIWIQFVT